LESVLGELKEAHKSGDISGIDTSMNKLNETWNRISTELYSQSNGEETPNGETQETQDVSFEEVK
jgi:molecular chaperone DnaK